MHNNSKSKNIKWVLAITICLTATIFAAFWYVQNKKNEDKEKLSIVLPIYNVSDYLPKCLDSLVNQTYKDIEMICVNDGSTDNSLDVLKEYQKKDSRIKIIDQKNGGVSSARNAGMREAKGKYLTFVDPDDYIDTDAYERCLNAMKRENVDMIVFNYIVEPGDSKSMPLDYKKKYTSPFELIDDDNLDHGYVWNKIFNRSVIADNDIWFKEDISFCEDNLFMKMVIPKAKGIMTFPEVFYHYCTRPDSLAHSKSYQKHLSEALLRAEYITDYYIKEGYIDRYDWLLKYCLDLTFDRINSLEDVEKQKYYSKIMIDLINTKLIGKVKNIPSDLEYKIEKLNSHL